MNLDLLAKTNSWHWLAAALVLSGALAGLLWQRERRHQEAEHQPILARQARHLEDLRALDEGSVDTLERQTQQLARRLEEWKAAEAQAGFPEIPKGSDSVIETANAFDQRLLAANLRIVSSVTEAPQEKASGKVASRASSKAEKDSAPISAAEYARQMQAMIASLPADLRGAAQKDAQRKIAQMEAAEKAAQKKAARKAARTSAQSAAKVAPAPAKLPFQTQAIAYEVEGQYKDLFLFLVREAARKNTYHLHNFVLMKTPQLGILRMTFTLQANYR